MKQKITQDENFLEGDPQNAFVSLRVRHCEGKEIPFEQIDNNILRWREPPYQQFKFGIGLKPQLDKIFLKETNQELWQHMIKPLIDKSLLGFDAIVIAYGNTGSSKTFTMLGSKEVYGIIQLSTEYILQSMLKMNGQLMIRYYQIYNERIYDLLQNDGKDTVYTNKNRCSQVEIYTIDDLKQQFLISKFNRKVAKTKMNQTSSRSHAILELFIQLPVKNSKGLLTKVRLNHILFVDLAGSESIENDNKNEQKKLNQEATKINLSLFNFNSVISQLIQNQKKDKKQKDSICFNNTQLTSCLENYLKENCLLNFIFTLRNDLEQLKSSLRTLQFSQSVCQMKLQPKQNQSVKKAQKELEEKDKLIKNMQEQMISKDKLVIEKDEIIEQKNIEIQKLSEQVFQLRSKFKDNQVDNLEQDQIQVDAIQIDNIQEDKENQQKHDPFISELKRMRKQRDEYKSMRKYVEKKNEQIVNPPFDFSKEDQYEKLKGIKILEFDSMFYNDSQPCRKNPFLIISEELDRFKIQQFIFAKFSFMIDYLSIFQGYERSFIVVHLNDRPCINLIKFLINSDNKYFVINMVVDEYTLECLKLKLVHTWSDGFLSGAKNSYLNFILKEQTSQKTYKVIEFEYKDLTEDKKSKISESIEYFDRNQMSKEDCLMFFKGQDNIKLIIHLNSESESITHTYFQQLGSLTLRILNKNLDVLHIHKYYIDNYKGYFKLNRSTQNYKLIQNHVIFIKNLEKIQELNNDNNNIYENMVSQDLLQI